MMNFTPRILLASLLAASATTTAAEAQPPFTLDLTPEQRKAGATFDRFGLTSFRRGGKFTTIYFDDLTYTTRRPADATSVRHEQKITTVPYPR